MLPDKSVRISGLLAAEDIPLEWHGEYALDSLSAREWSLINIRGSVVVSGEREPIHISRVGLKKVTSHDMYDMLHLKSLAMIPTLLKRAKFICEFDKANAAKRFDRYRYYVVGVFDGSGHYTVKIVVGVKNGWTYYDHNITKIEKRTLVEALNGVDDPVACQPSKICVYDTKIVRVLQVPSVDLRAFNMNRNDLLDYLKNGRSPMVSDAQDESLSDHDRRFHGGQYDASVESCEKRDSVGRNDDIFTVFRRRRKNGRMFRDDKNEPDTGTSRGGDCGHRGMSPDSAAGRSLASVCDDIFRRNGDAELGTTYEKGGQLSPESLRDIFLAVNSDPYNGRLFDLVFPVAKKLGVEYYAQNAPWHSRSLGFSQDGNVVLHLNKIASVLNVERSAAEVILHELIHSVTAYAIELSNGDVEIDGITVSPELKKAADDLESAYRENRKWLWGLNARKSLHEYIADLSHPSLRSRIEKPGVVRRLCDGIVRTVKTVVGASDAEGHRANDLNDLEGLLRRFLENCDTAAFERYQMDPTAWV